MYTSIPAWRASLSPALPAQARITETSDVRVTETGDIRVTEQ